MMINERIGFAVRLLFLEYLYDFIKILLLKRETPLFQSSDRTASRKLWGIFAMSI